MDLNVPMNFVKIPREFYSSLTREPFSECIACKNSLNENTYLVEKSFRQNPECDFRDIVFEYAMCLECYEKLNTGFSEESARKMDAYMKTNIQWEERRKELWQGYPLDPERWTAECIVKGTSREELRVFQIAAVFSGSFMILSDLPLLFGGEALEEMGELVSSKTREEMDRMYDDFFGPPPELKKLLLDHKILFV